MYGRMPQPVCHLIAAAAHLTVVIACFLGSAAARFSNSCVTAAREAVALDTAPRVVLRVLAQAGTMHYNSCYHCRWPCILRIGWSLEYFQVSQSSLSRAAVFLLMRASAERDNMGSALLMRHGGNP